MKPFGPIVGVFQKSSVITNHIPFSLLADVAITRCLLATAIALSFNLHSIEVHLRFAKTASQLKDYETVSKFLKSSQNFLI